MHNVTQYLDSPSKVHCPVKSRSHQKQWEIMKKCVEIWHYNFCGSYQQRISITKGFCHGVIAASEGANGLRTCLSRSRCTFWSGRWLRCMSNLLYTLWTSTLSINCWAQQHMRIRCCCFIKLICSMPGGLPTKYVAASSYDMRINTQHQKKSFWAIWASL